MENMFSILKISLVVVYEKESLYFFCILTVSIGEKKRRKRWEELVVKWLWAGYGSAFGEIDLLTVGWLPCGWNFFTFISWLLEYLETIEVAGIFEWKIWEYLVPLLVSLIQNCKLNYKLMMSLAWLSPKKWYFHIISHYNNNHLDLD